MAGDKAVAFRNISAALSAASARLHVVPVCRPRTLRSAIGKGLSPSGASAGRHAKLPLTCACPAWYAQERPHHGRTRPYPSVLFPC